MTARLAIPDFQLANPIYRGATVTFWTVNNAGAATTTPATLYDSATGTTTLANPQTLDGEGKFSAPVYISEPVIASVVGRNVGTHSTGVIGTMFAATPLAISGGTEGQVPIINSGGVPTWRTLSGAITIDQNGVATLMSLAASNLTNGTTGSGNVVLKTSPTLVTPNIGAATATTINGLTFTASTGTITLANGKTLVVNNSFTLAGTDAQTYAFPAATGTLMSKTSTDIMTNKTFDSAGTGNFLKVSGVALSRGQFPGDNSTSSATAGNIGEYIQASVASGSAVALTTGTAANIAFIDLTPGDWDVRAHFMFLFTGGTNVTTIISSISLTSATIDITAGRFSEIANDASGIVPGGGVSLHIPAARISINANTRVYFVANSAFTIGTNSGWGLFSARRAR